MQNALKTPTPASRMSAEQRREQILDAAKEVVGEKGFHAVTIDGVARAAGITRPVIYAHFDDRDGLLSALIGREGRRALCQLAELVPRCGQEGDPVDLLAECLQAFLEAARDDPITWRLVLMPPEGAPESLHASIARERTAVAAQLASVTNGAGSRGGTASPDPELTGLAMQALSEEAARLLLEDPKRFTVKRLVEHGRWTLDRLSTP